MIKLFQDKILANKKPSAKNSYTDEFSVSVGGIQLGNCHLAQYLGVIIDENLNWKPHVQYLQKKLSTAAGIITKMRYYLKEKKMLWRCITFFFHTYLLYGILGWGSATKSTLHPLQILQNKVMRIINKTTVEDHVKNNALYQNIKFLKLMTYINKSWESSCIFIT